jgi:thioredoxin reductase (NADPH)
MRVDDRPVIVAVDNEDPSRERLERTLSGRYGRDYRVLAEASASNAFELLRSMRDAEAPVALIIADQWMPEEMGSAFLARTRDLYPAAQRLLVTNWGDFSANEPIVQASVLGEIDYVTWHPLTEADEQFHAAVTEVLARWAKEHGRWGEAIKVVGERWDEHAQFLRDALARWSLPFGFHDADSPDGRTLLEQAGVSGPLPVVILASGRALARPSPADIAGALGATTTPIDRVLDVVVLGAGPAGLAAAVYASSEGLSVLAVEPISIGGQASSSPMLRNYLGFPAGVSGADLAARAYQQAWTFGADFLIGRTAEGIRAQGRDCPGVDGDARSLETSMTGVFAAGDLRHASLKRVAAAVGEGSTAVRQVHEYREAQARQLGERPV